MKTDYDVIIVGAGPAGASCAKHLVYNGVKTLVIEKEKLPRIKCCSGLLYKRAINFLKSYPKIPDRIINRNKIVRFMFTISGRKYRPLLDYEFLNIDRSEFDYWLINQSKSEVIDESIFIKHEKLPDYIKVYCRKNHKNVNFTCKYLIGADGSNSKVRRLLKNHPENKVASMQNIYKGDFNFDENVFHVSFNKKFTDEYFAWFNKKNDLIYIGTSWKNKNQNYFLKWYNYLSDKYKFKLNKIRTEGAWITIFDKKHTFFGKDNIFIAGEASGLISFMGEGISSALISGKELADSIITSDSPLNYYKTKIQKEVNYLVDFFNNIDLTGRNNK